RDLTRQRADPPGADARHVLHQYLLRRRRFADGVHDAVRNWTARVDAVARAGAAAGARSVIPAARRADWYARRVGVAAAREINEIPAARQSTDESRVRAAGIRCDRRRRHRRGRDSRGRTDRARAFGAFIRTEHALELPRAGLRP